MGEWKPRARERERERWEEEEALPSQLLPASRPATTVNLSPKPPPPPPLPPRLHASRLPLSLSPSLPLSLSLPLPVPPAAADVVVEPDRWVGNNPGLGPDSYHPGRPGDSLGVGPGNRGVGGDRGIGGGIGRKLLRSSA